MLVALWIACQAHAPEPVGKLSPTLATCHRLLVVCRAEEVGRYGQRLVAYVIPVQVGIADVTLYLDNGRYATATGLRPEPKIYPNRLRGDFWTLTPWVWHDPGGS